MMTYFVYSNQRGSNYIKIRFLQFSAKNNEQEMIGTIFRFFIHTHILTTMFLFTSAFFFSKRDVYMS